MNNENGGYAMKSRLEDMLAERRVKKRELADDVGVRPQAVGKWCTDKGMAGLTVGKLCRVADALACDPRDLFEP